MSSSYNPFNVLRTVLGGGRDERARAAEEERARILQEEIRRRVLGSGPGGYTEPERSPFRDAGQNLASFATFGIVPEARPATRAMEPPPTPRADQNERYNKLGLLEQQLFQAQDPRAFADIIANGELFKDAQPRTDVGALSDDERRGLAPAGSAAASSAFTLKPSERQFMPNLADPTQPAALIGEGAPSFGIANPGSTTIDRQTGQPVAQIPYAPRDVAPGHIVADVNPGAIQKVLAENRAATAAGQPVPWIEFSVEGGPNGVFNPATREEIIFGYNAKSVTTQKGALTNIVGGDPNAPLPVQPVAESYDTTKLGPNDRGVTTNPRTGAATVTVDAMPRLSEVAKTDRLFVTDSSGNTKMVAGAVPEPLRPSAKELLNYFTPESVKAAWVADGDYNLLEERPEALSATLMQAKTEAGRSALGLKFRQRFEKAAEPFWKEAEVTRALFGSIGTDDPELFDPDVLKATRMMLDLGPTDPLPPAHAVRDIAMIFTVMKSLDRESVVRESEQELIRSAKSMFGKAATIVEKALNGKTLDSTQRAQMAEVAFDMVKAKQKPYLSLVEKWRGLAEKHGVDPDLVTVDAMDDIRRLLGAGGGSGGSAWDSIMQAEQGISAQGGAVSRQTMLEALQKAGVEDMSEEDAAKFNKAYPE